MSHTERRPGAVHQGGDRDRRGPSIQDSPLDDVDVRAEVWRVLAPIFAAARKGRNRILGVGTVEWWEASDPEKLGGVANLALAYLIQDPLRAEAQRLKAAAVAISEAANWTDASRRPSHATLAARRAEPGPMARPFDPEAAARWARTGSSRERAG